MSLKKFVRIISVLANVVKFEKNSHWFFLPSQAKSEFRFFRYFQGQVPVRVIHFGMKDVCYRSKPQGRNLTSYILYFA